LPRLSRRSLVLAAAGLTLAPVAYGQAAAEQDFSLGRANAKVKVVEYASLSCPHCAAFHAEVFPAFKKKYIDTGKVRFTFKEVLTEPAMVAAAGFLLARCAGPDKYFQVVADAFHSQAEWGSIGPRAALVKVAAKAGLDEAAFEKCVGDDAALQAMNARIGRDAEAAGIRSTPTFFINDKKVEGAMTLAELDAAIAAAAK
jgi:protein-disulfide isomerase